MTTIRAELDGLAFAAHQAGKQGEPLGECLEVAEWIALIERNVAALVAERDAEEACARLHAGLLREVAAAMGHAHGDDRSTLPERVRAMRASWMAYKLKANNDNE